MAGVVLFFFYASALVLSRIAHFQSSHLPPPTGYAQLFLALSGAISAGFTEEVTFRGYLYQQYLQLSGRTWIAAGLQALLFATAHGYDHTWSEGIFTFAAGLLFAWPMLRGKSVFPCIVAHCVIDLTGTVALYLKG